MAVINRKYRFHLDGCNAISQIRFSEEPTIRLHVRSDLAGDCPVVEFLDAEISHAAQHEAELRLAKRASDARGQAIAQEQLSGRRLTQSICHPPNLPMLQRR